MKTFREFFIIAETSAADIPKNDPGYGGGSSATEADVDKMSHLSDREKELFKKRIRAKNQRVSRENMRSGSTSTQTQPRQPSGSTRSTQTQTPPRGAQQPSGAQQTPSAGRNPNPYRNTHYKGSGGAGKPPSGPSNLATTPPKPATGPGLRSRLGKVAGPAGTVATGALEYKDRRDAGQSRARALGGAVASSAGWAKGAQMGANLAARVPVPHPLAKAAVVGTGGLIGGLAGEAGTKAAYDFAADKTRPARQAVSKATGFDKFQQKNALIKQGSGLQKAQQTMDTRSARAASSAYGTKKGSGLSGIGGNTVVSKDKKGAAFMSTGAGSQRKTVELAKTQLVRDPKSGKQVVGDLAFKGGKATYVARPSVSSRDTSLGARVGRALNIGRYSKEAEQKAAKQEYRTALKNTQTYQKKLGVTPKAATAQKLPGQGVGPKKVGPKLVGPKIVGPKK
jgi:hypothetical protein